MERIWKGYFYKVSWCEWSSPQNVNVAAYFERPVQLFQWLVNSICMSMHWQFFYCLCFINHASYRLRSLLGIIGHWDLTDRLSYFFLGNRIYIATNLLNLWKSYFSLEAVILNSLGYCVRVMYLSKHWCFPFSTYVFLYSIFFYLFFSWKYTLYFTFIFLIRSYGLSINYLCIVYPLLLGPPLVHPY